MPLVSKKFLFLGHDISKCAFSPGLLKTAVIAKLPQSVVKEPIQRCPLLCSYYRRVVNEFTSITTALTHLSEPAVEFKWKPPEI